MMEEDDKLTIVFDLDDTLIHSKIDGGKATIHVRDGTVALLEYCFSHPEWIRVVFWTLSKRAYALIVLQVLRKLVSVPMFYELLTPDDGFVGPKTLQRVSDHCEVPIERIMAVDDLLSNYPRDLNVIRVTPYTYTTVLSRLPDFQLHNILILLKLQAPKSILSLTIM